MQPLITVKRRDHADGVRVQRFDQAEAHLGPSSRTADGYLRVQAAVAVAGVMEYEDADGKITRELSPPDELYKVDSLRTLASVPTTLDHPAGDVTPENVGELGTGDVGEQIDILSDTGHVRVTMVIRRKDALDAAADGVIEVSPGYTCIMDPTPGVHPVYGPYDAIQRDRVYNHVAQVPEARGGHTVKMRADAARSKPRLVTPAFPDVVPRVERHDGVTVRRFDSSSAPRTGDQQMNPLLLLLATSLGLPVQSSPDGKKYVRSRADAVDVPAEMTEGDLLNLIIAAANKLVAMKTPSAADPNAAGAAAGDVAALQTENADLKRELAAAKQDKANRDAAEAKKLDEADRKRLDALAKKLEFDTTAWRTDTKTIDRKVDLLRHDGVLGKDDKAPSEETVNGMILMLEHRKHDGETEDRDDGKNRRSDWADADLDTDKPVQGGPNAPAHARKDRAVDSFQVGLAKSRAAARGEKVA